MDLEVLLSLGFGKKPETSDEEIAAAQLAAFDEGAFPPSTGAEEEYYATIQRGVERIRESRVAFIGLARNIAWILPWTIARIERLRSFCKDSIVIVFENDSKDSTREILNLWSEFCPGIHLLGQNYGDSVHPPTRNMHRVARMAFYRQQCWRKLRELDWLDAKDYVCLVDMDLEGGISLEGWLHSFGLDVQWDMVGANGLIVRDDGIPGFFYRDAFAWREGDWMPLPNLVPNLKGYMRGDPPVPLLSCFGGLGIYRRDAYYAGRYTGGDCEHVPFHRRMRENGFASIMMNPSMIVLYTDIFYYVRRWMSYVDVSPIPGQIVDAERIRQSVRGSKGSQGAAV
jgi:hypothetical protein